MFLLKWRNFKRPTWTPKSDMNCHKMLIDFESENGPTVLGNFKMFDLILSSKTTNKYLFICGLHSELLCFSSIYFVVVRSMLILSHRN